MNHKAHLFLVDGWAFFVDHLLEYRAEIGWLSESRKGGYSNQPKLLITDGSCGLMDEGKRVSGKLSHVDPHGKARMVDVGEKSVSRRTARATAICVMNEPTADAIRSNSLSKGDVLQVSRLAGIGAAKRTDELIPLCHTVPLDDVQVEFQWLESTRLQILTTACATGRTGVEMEALVAASAAALTVYDMCKSSDRAMSIECIQLQSKTGGVRGDYHRYNG